MNFFNLFQKNKRSDVSSIKKQNIIIDFEDHLALILNIVLQFKDAYLQAVPDEMFAVFISQDIKGTDYSENYYTYDGQLKIEILVGNWWNNILYRSQDIQDKMENIFEYDDNKKSFIHDEIMTGKSTCSPFPKEKVNEKLQVF